MLMIGSCGVIPAYTANSNYKPVTFSYWEKLLANDYIVGGRVTCEAYASV